MRLLIEDIRRSFHAEAYSTALVTTLSLPDACAAVDYPDLRGRQRYINWYDTNVSHRLDLGRGRLTGAVVYLLRCGLSHELRIDDDAGSAQQMFFALPSDRANRIAITDLAFHGKTALVVDLGMFIGDVIEAVERWLRIAEADQERAERLKGLVKLETHILNSWFGPIPALG